MLNSTACFYGATNGRGIIIPELTEELADLTIYVYYLAANLGIDLDEAVSQKIVKNGEKYPATNS